MIDDVRKMIDQLLDEEYQDSVENTGYASTNRVSQMGGREEQAQREAEADSVRENQAPQPQIPAGDPTKIPVPASSLELTDSPPAAPAPITDLPSATPAGAPVTPPAPPLSESVAPPEFLHDDPTLPIPSATPPEPPTLAPTATPPAEPSATEPPEEIPLVGSIGDLFPAEQLTFPPTASDEPRPPRTPPPSKSSAADVPSDSLADWDDTAWNSGGIGEGPDLFGTQDDFGFMAELAGRGNFT